ncbi:MAG: type II toxin-antitoxin system ParD family antitoxin [Alphaproteobacteria bacterium]|nr:type II toxin-antitoxin system ParD family antitoxin [Alphaproteobacteria bacterium]
MNVSLTPKLEKLVADCVNSGEYNNASEVVRQALRVFQAEQELRRAKLKRLKAEIARGEADIKAGRFTEIASDAELNAFFKSL